MKKLLDMLAGLGMFCTFVFCLLLYAYGNELFSLLFSLKVVK